MPLIVLMPDALGWISSAILMATLSRQIYKQWQIGSSEGVSIWLFIGQVAASIGFTVYSLMVKNNVFAVTNALILLNALAGYGLTLWQRKRS